MRIGKNMHHKKPAPAIDHHIVHKMDHHQKMVCHLDEVPELCPYMSPMKHHKKHKILHKKYHHHHRFHPSLMHPGGPHMKHISPPGPHHVGHPGGHHHHMYPKVLHHHMHPKGPHHHMNPQGPHHMHPKGPHHHHRHLGFSHSRHWKFRHHNKHHRSSSSSSSSSESEDDGPTNSTAEQEGNEGCQESNALIQPLPADGCKCQRKLEKKELKRKNKIEKIRQKCLKKANKNEKRQHKLNSNDNVPAPEHEEVPETGILSSEDSATPQQHSRDDMHLFMQNVSNQVKNLSPEMIALAKVKILEAVNDLQLNEDNNASKDEGTAEACTSKEQGTADNEIN